VIAIKQSARCPLECTTRRLNVKGGGRPSLVSAVGARLNVASPRPRGLLGHAIGEAALPGHGALTAVDFPLEPRLGSEAGTSAYANLVAK